MGLFDDMLTSYRGAGVMGTVLGLVVLGGFGLLATLAFDPANIAPGLSLDGTIAAQGREIARLQEELDAAKLRQLRYQELKASAGELEKIIAGNQERENKLDQLARLQERVGNAEVKIDAEAASYVRRFREQVREAAVGESVAKLVTMDGRVIENATISQVTAAGVHLRHADGILRLPPDELPLEMSDRFQFDDAEMGEFLARERAEVQTLERDIDEGIATQDLTGRVRYLERRIAVVKGRLARNRNYLAELNKIRQSRSNYADICRKQIKKDEVELKDIQPELARLKKELKR